VRRRSGVLVVATLLLTFGCDEPGAGPAPAEGELHFLTYNVHGLPPAITGDDTSARMVEIAPLLGAFDVVGLQEDFDDTNHQVLADASEHRTQRRFDELLTEEKVYGSGLAVFADLLEVDYLHEHYRDCNGFVDAASDCLASKGFQALRLELAPGATVDVYNSHLEAGGGAADNAARHENVTQLIEAMNGWSAGHSVVFLGDTNLRKSDPDDLPELERWIGEAGLVDACEAVDCPNQDHIDRLFVRPGSGVTWEVLSWADESAFFDEEGTPLSDHPALSSRMRWDFVPSE
jgi:endonuclease/exonuclease/phosphatase family metal-dependent hydrolase